jgi:hypothetical protein
MRNFLVEVFAVVKVNLLLFKGKIAGMRATLRSRFVGALLYFESMKQTMCPPLQHFHIVYEQVGSFKRPNKTVIALTEADALNQFLSTLPRSWRGGVSVFDDSIGHEDEMPNLHVVI